MAFDISTAKFDSNGLIPAIIQDYYTKEVLTLAYMNKESLEISINEKKTCFYSRSRNELWRKGETSGNYQNIVSMKLDCDSDSIVVEVIKDGPACHTGKESCFYNTIFQEGNYSNFSFVEFPCLIGVDTVAVCPYSLSLNIFKNKDFLSIGRTTLSILFLLKHYFKYCF